MGFYEKWVSSRQQHEKKVEATPAGKGVVADPDLDRFIPLEKYQCSNPPTAMVQSPDVGCPVIFDSAGYEAPGGARVG
jgi:hypothetical protein